MPLKALSLEINLKIKSSRKIKLFNESQNRAVKAALSANLVLIQGPPGSGKSHVAVRII
jgi:superfamily II DNA or RNA helicase